MTKTIGHSRERCLLELRSYWDEMDTLHEELERLAESDARRVRAAQVQLAQILRDLDADIELRRGASAIVRMSEAEAGTFLPTLRAVRTHLQALSDEPDGGWPVALSHAQDLLQDASRRLSRGHALDAPHHPGLGA